MFYKQAHGCCYRISMMKSNLVFILNSLLIIILLLSPNCCFGLNEESEFKELVNDVFCTDKDCPPYEIDDMREMFSEIKEAYSKLNPLAKIMNRQDVEDVDRLSWLDTCDNCSPISIGSFTESKKLFWKKYPRLQVYLYDCENRLKQACQKQLLELIEKRDLSWKGTKKWDKFRQFIGDHITASEFLMMNSSQQQTISLKALAKYIDKKMYLRKTSDLSWIDYNYDFAIEVNSIISGLCDGMNSSELVHNIKKINSLDSTITEMLDESKKKKLERILISENICLYDWKRLFEGFVARNYGSKYIFELLFKPDSDPLDPLEVSLLLEVLINYPKLIDETSREEENWSRASELIRIPEDPNCTNDEMRKIGFNIQNIPIDNIQNYIKEYSGKFLNVCIETLELEYKTDRRDRCCNEAFRNLVDPYLEQNQNLYPLSGITNESMEIAVIKYLNASGLRLNRRRFLPQCFGLICSYVNHDDNIGEHIEILRESCRKTVDFARNLNDIIHVWLNLLGPSLKGKLIESFEASTIKLLTGFKLCQTMLEDRNLTENIKRRISSSSS